MLDFSTAPSTTLHMNPVCKVCNKTYHFTVTVAEVEQHQKGAYVQDAYPNLTDDQRELLISGICGPCFDSLYSEEES